jgi:DNA-binding MarR family transcriptional regulator
MPIIRYADDMKDVPLGFLMSHLAEVLRELTTKALGDFGLSPREYGILWRLESHGPLSQRELGDLHQIDRTTVVAVVDRLEAMDLVVRHTDPADRRRHSLELTDSGRARLTASTFVVERVEDEFLVAVGPSERQRLSEILRTILDSGVGR